MEVLAIPEHSSALARSPTLGFVYLFTYFITIGIPRPNLLYKLLILDIQLSFPVPHLSLVSDQIPTKCPLLSAQYHLARLRPHGICLGLFP